LQNHWKTWMIENDFIAMAAAGLNHVRYVNCRYPFSSSN
jgi:aryl-phospho-beta-D-glucosidase BglC (GH1 family)